MQTFCILTLGCKVNHYESEQVAAVLRARGLRQLAEAGAADLRIVNTCGVTSQAMSKSRQAVRKLGRSARPGQRTLVIGCAGSGDPSLAAMPGVGGLIHHRQDVAAELARFLDGEACAEQPPASQDSPFQAFDETAAESARDNGWMIQASTPGAHLVVDSNKATSGGRVKLISLKTTENRPQGTRSLPALRERQREHHRAFLKIQDGCDAACTFCIIPRLRPALWSRPLEQVLEEAQRMVAAGHAEIVLTGIFLGAYGQGTALRRRQDRSIRPLARLLEALCTRVPGLRRLRLSSLEPGDLDGELLGVLRGHPILVPHFHLPLQSGCDAILRRMNRQYGRDDYLRMLDAVLDAFDRPALTTDIIAGFPGEDEAAFARTLEVVDRVRFMHIHAFPFSPRAGTAAARWREQFVREGIIRERIRVLQQRSAESSLAFRRQFLGQEVQALVESRRPGMQRGRCERHFMVGFAHPVPLSGRCVKVRIDDVSQGRTLGVLAEDGR